MKANWGRSLRLLFHFQHVWDGTYYNTYMSPVEQRCSVCHAYRHHLLEDLRGFDEPRWRDGKHPNRPKEGFM